MKLTEYWNTLKIMQKNMSLQKLPVSFQLSLQTFPLNLKTMQCIIQNVQSTCEKSIKN